MLSNAYFLAKFRFDTAENEPAKNLQNFVNFPNFANPKWSTQTAQVAEHEKICEFRNNGQFFCNQGCGFCGSFFVVAGAVVVMTPGYVGMRCRQAWNGSFSAVSKPMFESEYVL